MQKYNILERGERLIESFDTIPNLLNPTNVGQRSQQVVDNVKLTDEQIQNLNNLKIQYNYIIKNIINLKNNYNINNYSQNETQVNNVYQQQLSQYESQLNLLANQINIETNNIKTKNLTANQQLSLNSITINNDYTSINNLKNSSNSTNLSGFLEDTNTRLLQESYNYSMWTIITIGLLIIVVNNL